MNMHTRINKVLDYNIVNSMCSLTNEYVHWNIALWKENRKLYKALKTGKDSVARLHETLTYKILSSNELYVERGIDIMNTFIALCNAAKTHDYLAKDPEDLINRMNSLVERSEAILVLIEMSDHENSIWS